MNIAEQIKIKLSEIYSDISTSNEEIYVARIGNAETLKAIGSLLNIEKQQGPSTSRPDLHILALEEINDSNITLIAQSKLNKLQQSIVVALNDNHATNIRMISLGFRREIKSEHQGLYCFNISEYIRKRDWNNAKYWANPENFDKFRW